MGEEEPRLGMAPKGREVVVDGVPFSVEIYRLEGPAEWTLEVIDPEGVHHVWDEFFGSDKDARTAAVTELEEKGPWPSCMGIMSFRSGRGRALSGEGS